MSEFILTVPAEHAEDFRAAFVHEIATDAGRIKEGIKELEEQTERQHPHVELTAADLHNAIEYLGRDLDLGPQVGLGDSAAIEIRTEDFSTLAQVCETMAQEVVAPELTRQLNYTPIDEVSERKLRPLLERLTWAIDKAAELHAAYALDERQAVGS